MSPHQFIPARSDPFNIQPASPATITTLTGSRDPFNIPADRNSSEKKNDSDVRRTLRRKGRQSEDVLQNPLAIPPHNNPQLGPNSSRSPLVLGLSHSPLHSPITYPEPAHTTLTWGHDDGSDSLSYHMPGDRHLL
ncbi:hypothetical protein FBU59_005047 [Linderina macrospora]|uniref:Uncharacterized protein n=1 Tax=Linderina macrospora TaxID=4868 RepID=A0ACC1J3Z4_9FUNG|nr:hypothetical protein FBU59_005047 [Linderina macrospora]